MNILVKQQPNYYFGFAYAANLFGNAPSSEMFVENPVNKPDSLPFNTVEGFSTKLCRELKAVKKQQVVAFGMDYELFNDNFRPEIFETALRCCLKFGFHAAIATSSDDIINYLPLLQRLAPLFCTVAVKIPSCNDSELQIMQPGFPLFQQRLQLIKRLTDANIKTGVWINPVLPFINDTAQNFDTILEAAAQNGAMFSAYHKKLSLNENSRPYLFNNIATRAPQLADKYAELFNGKDETYGPNLMELSNAFTRTSRRCNLVTHWPPFSQQQLSLF